MASNIWHDTVGAEVVAPFLDFNHAAGAEDIGLACAVRCLSQIALDQLRQALLFAIAYDEIDAFQFAEFPGVSVSVAAHRYYRRIWVSPPRQPHKVTRLAVGCTGHGACVQDVDVGRFIGRYQLVSLCCEPQR